MMLGAKRAVLASLRTIKFTGRRGSHPLHLIKGDYSLSNQSG
jgi:hypothetical protein